MMRDMWTIFRREMAAYFNSPMGYIFLIVFVLINSGLFVTGFFEFPVAEMRAFFNVLPVMLCVFVPAVSMRLWAEERKDNTLELLLTFPMRIESIVLGKYMAGLTFLGMALAATGTIPIMLEVLGRPDWGQILSSYLGAFLLGGFFMSVGIFISGLSRDQIVAFVLALLVSFGLFLVGTNFVAAAIDEWAPGVGYMLKDLVGVTPHYASFSKGIIEVADVVFFMVWTMIFLLLNAIHMDGRARRSARAIFTAALVLCLAIGLSFNGLVRGYSLGRFDVTEDKVYSVSEATKRVLGKLRVPVQVNYYVTPASEMPTELKNLERDVVDKLEEMRVASRGKLAYKVIHMRAANVLRGPEPQTKAKDKESETLEQLMLEKGVEPFSVRARRKTGVITKLIYSSIGVAYKEKKEEIIPRVTPASLPELEYQLVSTVYRLTRERQPRIAMVAPLLGPQLDPQLLERLRMMGRPVPQPQDPYKVVERFLRHEKYQVTRVKFNKDDPLPENYDLLLIIHPKRLNERQRWEVARALSKGKPVVLAVQNYTWDYRLSKGRLSVVRVDEDPEINDLLKRYGVEIEDGILMDSSSAEIRIHRSDLERLFGGGVGIRLPTHILIGSEGLNRDEPITSRLSGLFYLWGSAIRIDQKKLSKNGLKAAVLATTSPRAWQIKPKERLGREDIIPPSEGRRAYPIIVRLSGTFPDVYKGEPPPPWPGEQKDKKRTSQKGSEGEQEASTEKQGKSSVMIIIGGAQMFGGSLLGAGGLRLLLNCVDALALSRDIVSIRGNRPISRIIADVTEAQELTWKGINYALAGVVIAALGFARFAWRRRKRAQYRASLKR
jgi:ABC-type uncharacterized transport system involved in gliding motility auxiliary subunit/ABC-type transport system involved in multi-copper enzyme maturation permease subunit